MNTTTRHGTTAAAHIVHPRRPETTTDGWENRAACYNRPEAWWDGEDPGLTEKARATCLSCPVLAECLGEQMRLETGQMWSRSCVRGGLTGPERIRLCIDEQADGPYDAEEARLLALEAGAYGKPVAEIAEDGVSVSTVRLAARMAGEHVPVRDVEKARKGTALERGMPHATQIMQWREANVPRDEIAARLGLSRTAVDAVIGVYRTLTKGAAAEPVEVNDAEKTLINDYLNGQPVQLTAEQHIAAILEGLKQGMKYPDIDHAQGYRLGTTAQFVSRQRKKYQQAGQTFPITTEMARRITFTDKQVRAIREIAATGKVTDLELAMRYGVARNVISHLVSGRNYRNAGGPIRQGMSDASKQASKKWNDKACLEAFAPSQAAKASRKRMEKAA
jgi:hypothetical protein